MLVNKFHNLQLKSLDCMKGTTGQSLTMVIQRHHWPCTATGDIVRRLRVVASNVILEN